MLRHLNILNIILIAICVFAGLYGYRLYEKKVEVVIKDDNSSSTMMEVINVDSRKKLQSKGEYIVINEKNLFHPNRKYEKPTPVKKPKPKAPPPNFMVYGTLITKEKKLAFVVDNKKPYTSPGRGNRQRVVHLGQSLHEYVLKEVRPYEVVFANGKDRYTFKVLSSEKNKKRKPLAMNTPGKGKIPGGNRKGKGKGKNELRENIFTRKPKSSNKSR